MRQYYCVNSQELPNLETRLMQASRIALDTETTGLEVFASDFQLVGIAIADSAEEAFYLPLAHQDFGGLSYQPPNLDSEAVQAMLRRIIARVPVVYHNGAYDRMVLAKTLNLPLDSTLGDDTMLALHLMDENHPLSLKEWSKTLLGLEAKDQTLPDFTAEEFITSESVVALNKSGRRYRKQQYRLREDWLDKLYAHFKKLHQGAVSYNTLYKLIAAAFGVLRLRGVVDYNGSFPNDFRYFPVRLAAEYALDDVINTWQLWQQIEAYFELYPTQAKLYREIELPVNDVMLRATYTGVKVDQNHLRHLRELLDQRIEETKNTALTVLAQLLSPEQLTLEFKLETILNSSTQLSKLLYTVFGLPVVERTETGHPSTSRTALQTLLKQRPVPAKRRQHSELIYRFLEAKLQYEALRKLRSTYTDSLLEQVDAEGRLHTHYNTVGTVSGRMSSSNPNLQNLPRLMPEEVVDKPYLQGLDIRKAFVADDGWVFVTADYASMELVMCAAVSGDVTMRELLNQGRDLHAYTARYAFGIGHDLTDAEFKTRYKDYRQKAKIVNFALIYGGTQYTLIKNFGFSEKEAEHLIAGYFQAYPQVKTWMEQVYRELETKGYVEYPLYGYIKRLDLPSVLQEVPPHQRKRLAEINPNLRKQFFAALRTCQNALIQGMSAFIVKEAIVCIDQRLRNESLPAQVLFQVHDEIGVLSQENVAPRVAQIMLECMRRTINGVHLEAEPEFKRTMSKAETPLELTYAENNS